MSFCSNTIQACNIDRCYSTLVVGQVLLPNEEYTVHIQNLQTGNYYREDVVSDDEGYIVLYKGEYEFMEGFCYELYVTAKGDCTPEDVVAYGGEFDVVRFDINSGCYKTDELYGIIERLKL